MRIVISGATGFLGGHTLNFLLKMGLDAIGTSRKIEDTQRKIIRSETPELMPEGDILIHFAESNSKFEVNERKDEYLEYIESYTKRIIEKYPKIVYASSIAVYPENLEGLRSPTEEIISHDYYSRAKRLVEEIVLAHSSNSIVGRIGNAYGSDMSKQNVISAILDQFRERRETINLISGEPVRDYIWCEDIASAFYQMAKSSKSGIFNIATGVGHSVKDICDLVAAITDHPNYVLQTQKVILNSNVIMDISSTLEHFDWKPSVLLREGLEILLKEQ